jgi:hypothetical protein
MAHSDIEIKTFPNNDYVISMVEAFKPPVENSSLRITPTRVESQPISANQYHATLSLLGSVGNLSPNLQPATEDLVNRLHASLHNVQVNYREFQKVYQEAQDFIRTNLNGNLLYSIASQVSRDLKLISRFSDPETRNAIAYPKALIDNVSDPATFMKFYPDIQAFIEQHLPDSKARAAAFMDRKFASVMSSDKYSPELKQEARELRSDLHNQNYSEDPAEFNRAYAVVEAFFAKYIDPPVRQSTNMVLDTIYYAGNQNHNILCDNLNFVSMNNSNSEVRQQAKQVFAMLSQAYTKGQDSDEYQTAQYVASQFLGAHSQESNYQRTMLAIDNLISNPPNAQVLADAQSQKSHLTAAWENRRLTPSTYEHTYEVAQSFLKANPSKPTLQV